jgi:hypothetical protein
MNGTMPINFDANASLAFENVIVSSLSSISDSRYVNVKVGTVLDTSRKLRVRSSELLDVIETSVFSLFKTASSNRSSSISIPYSLTIIIEATKFTTSPTLRAAVFDQLSLVLSNNEFINKLKAADVGKFGNVRTTTLISLSPATIVVLSTPMPTTAPTVTKVAAASSSSSSNFSMIHNYLILLLMLVITIVL